MLIVVKVKSIPFGGIGCKENTFMITSTVFVSVLLLFRPLPPPRPRPHPPPPPRPPPRPRLVLLCSTALKMRL